MLRLGGEDREQECAPRTGRLCFGGASAAPNGLRRNRLPYGRGSDSSVGASVRLREERHEGYFDVAEFGPVGRLETDLDCVAFEDLVPGRAGVDFGGGGGRGVASSEL
jgi:hypothetical protein